MCEMSYSSTDTTKIAAAMLRVQSKLHPAVKDCVNPFIKNTYASLNSVMNTCRTVLLQEGIWLTQYPVPAEPGFLGLVTKLTHAESGQWQSSLAVVPLPKNDPQGMGIAMTYSRRYVLSAMLGLVTEEDTDGEVATPKHQQTGSKTPEPSLPRLDGVKYEKTRGHDGREYCIARGGTAAKKDLLIGAGFRWSSEKKFWWRPAYAV